MLHTEIHVLVPSVFICASSSDKNFISVLVEKIYQINFLKAEIHKNKL